MSVSQHPPEPRRARSATDAARSRGGTLRRTLPSFALQQIAAFNRQDMLIYAAARSDPAWDARDRTGGSLPTEMEVTVIDSGDLPPGAIISFHTGTTRRHAQIETGKAIGVTGIGTEPVRVDLMTQIGSYSFDVTPGQDVYEVPIAAAPNLGVKLKFQIRETSEERLG
eukprot:s4410_g5.t1